MPRQLRPDLVIPHSEGEGNQGRRVRKLGDRLVVINLIAAKVRKRHDALFRDHVVEFKLAHLDVEPARFQKIAEADVCSFKTEYRVTLRSRHQQKADVLRQRTGGEDVHTGKIETVGGKPPFGRASGRRIRSEERRVGNEWRSAW